MTDPYVYPNSKVLRNLLNIEEEAALDLAEAELSRKNMMLLDADEFSDFSSNGMQHVHKALFSDVQELISSSASYVRDSFFMASIGEHAEYQHLEKILRDAICTQHIELGDDSAAENSTTAERYQKYHRENYKYHSHEYRDNVENSTKQPALHTNHSLST